MISVVNSRVAALSFEKCGKAYDCYKGSRGNEVVLGRCLKVFERHALTPRHMLWKATVAHALGYTGKALHDYMGAANEAEVPTFLQNITPDEDIHKHWTDTVRAVSLVRLASLLPSDSAPSLHAEALGLFTEGYFQPIRDGRRLRDGSELVIRTSLSALGIDTEIYLPHAAEHANGIFANFAIVAGDSRLPVAVRFAPTDTDSKDAYAKRHIALLSSIDLGIDPAHLEEVTQATISYLQYGSIDTTFGEITERVADATAEAFTYAASI